MANSGYKPSELFIVVQLLDELLKFSSNMVTKAGFKEAVNATTSLVHTADKTGAIEIEGAKLAIVTLTAILTSL